MGDHSCHHNKNNLNNFPPIGIEALKNVLKRSWCHKKIGNQCCPAFYLLFEYQSIVLVACSLIEHYESNDPVCDLVEKLEEIHKNIFTQTSQNIKKAQKHQAKCYNARHSGTPFKIGEKGLKRNMRDASCKQKMRNQYTGPYQITGISFNGQYYLKDKYSHQLKRPVPANQLVWYYGVGGFHRHSQHVDVENCENHSSHEIGAASDSESIPCDTGIVSDSQSISDEIGCTASDSECIPCHTHIASDSDSIPDSIGAAESDSHIILHNMDISDTESIQESDRFQYT